MGAGTGSENASRHEEPAVETQTPLTGDLEVDLDPEDVWTLGQLIEAGAVSFPPGVAEELMTGYRILQASGYEPPEGAQTNVELRGSGEASDLDLPIEELEEAGGVTARRVILTEITSEEAEQAEDGTLVEPGVETDAEGQPRPDGSDEAALEQALLQQAANGPVAGPAETERLASAIEDLANKLEDLPVERSTPETREEPASVDLLNTHGALVLDWALIGLGLSVSTLLVLAAAVIADPVFAILGIALLVLCIFQAVPYLVEEAGAEEGIL